MCGIVNIKTEKNTLFFWLATIPAPHPHPRSSSSRFHSFSRRSVFRVSPFSPSSCKYSPAGRSTHPPLPLFLSSVRIWGAVFQVCGLPTSRANLCRWDCRREYGCWWIGRGSWSWKQSSCGLCWYHWFQLFPIWSYWPSSLLFCESAPANAFAALWLLTSLF